jgi:hypothetical protein
LEKGVSIWFCFVEKCRNRRAPALSPVFRFRSHNQTFSFVSLKIIAIRGQIRHLIVMKWGNRFAIKQEVLVGSILAFEFYFQ